MFRSSYENNIKMDRREREVVHRNKPYQIRDEHGISEAAERLVSSQDGLSFVELLHLHECSVQIPLFHLIHYAT
jgi:hypothetical protein